ncbi:MAG: hypothetical protein KDE31_25790, partial [Caldilineaceae bacterium]|nr:hypothetical protein [Caldilineaceae bacterium]
MLNKLNHRRLPVHINSSLFDRWLLPVALVILAILAAGVINILLTNFVFTGLSTGASAPLFTGETLDGQQIDLA